jgi:hypothetical protein
MPETHMSEAVTAAVIITWLVLVGIAWEIICQAFDKKDQDD